MKNITKIMNKLNTINIAHTNVQYLNSQIKELEVFLQKNIEVDELLVSENKEPVNTVINEKIKKVIVDTQFCMLLSHYDRNKPIKIYLDDKRTTPDGYIRIFWPNDIYSFLTTVPFKIEEISLDHDLGNDEIGTGYDIVTLIEEWVYLENYLPPVLKVHSDNSSAKAKMLNGIKNINEKVAIDKDTRTEFPTFILKNEEKFHDFFIEKK